MMYKIDHHLVDAEKERNTYVVVTVEPPVRHTVTPFSQNSQQLEQAPIQSHSTGADTGFLNWGFKFARCGSN